MVHVKKLVLKGFKSFAKETPIDFTDSMNVIVGPNGSGKSNITDAICFVLGRMSIKSMRAAKASNLIFTGTKQYKPVSEASVKLILDNTDKTFSIPEKEVSVERVVRKKGQSLYKINNQIKTRQEVLELLSHAGIDPYGFNIVLQGEISSFIKMHSEERRKIIEEVAGISVYENRKQKSLRELDKTDERLKEVSATLKERTAYLRNLEEERRQALRFKKLQSDTRKYRASIIKRKLIEKQKELSNIDKQREQKQTHKEKEKQRELAIRNKIQELEEKANKINSQIQTSSGVEQEKLNKDISDLRAELAGLNVRKDSNETKLDEILSRKQKTEQDVKNLTLESKQLRKDSSLTKKQQDLESKKQEHQELEKQRKSFYSLKEKLNSIKEKIKDKSQQTNKTENQYSFLLKEIDTISNNLKYADTETCRKNLDIFRKNQEKSQLQLETLQEKSKEEEKSISVLSSQISELGKIKSQVSKLDICPLCKSKITEQHIKEVFKESEEKMSSFKSKLETKEKFIEKAIKQIENLKSELTSLNQEISITSANLIKLENIEEKKEQIKSVSNEQKLVQQEILKLESERKTIEKKILQFVDIEERYETIFLELQEISSRTEENIDAQLQFKQRDLEKTKLLIKQLDREQEELQEELDEFNQDIELKEQELEQKESENQSLEEKYQKLIETRNNYQKQVHQNNSILLEIQHKSSVIDSNINDLKIEIARISAEKENLDTDFETYKGTEILSLPVYALEDKLRKTQELLDRIGSVNLRALDVYEKMKKEYDSIYEKVEILDKEKLEIIKIIEEIDKKKIRTFKKTLKSVNELFNRNFIQLYSKGEAFLELENREDPFAAGLDIIIKVGKGKYFDVTSLSGGEQTLVALSLIFAIQEYKPYCFYILDEVDAALDKRNSERLASLVKKYMKSGQYIIVTHNDAIITESSTLYGVSMQEGLSKILSLEV